MRIEVQDDEAVEVAMAPLIDCVFLLLIFFLVATTLKKIDEELPVELAQSAAAVEVQQPDDYTIIGIDRNLSYYVDGTPVSLGLLQSNLRSRARENQDLKIRIDADREVPFHKIVEVLDILQFENLHHIGFKTHQAHAAPEKD